MENEQILSALTKLLEDQKDIQKLNGKLSLFLEKIHSEQGLAKNDTTDLKQLKEDVLKIQKHLSEMPKNVIQERRFLFFPEHNAKEYYSTILRWLLYALIATYAFWLLKFLVERLR